MLEPIIRVIARRMLQNEDEVFHAVKQNVIAPVSYTHLLYAGNPEV